MEISVIDNNVKKDLLWLVSFAPNFYECNWSLQAGPTVNENSRSFVYKGSRLQRIRLQRVPGYLGQISLHQNHWLAMLKSSVTTSSFFRIFLLVVSGTQCTYLIYDIYLFIFCRRRQNRRKRGYSWHWRQQVTYRTCFRRHLLNCNQYGINLNTGF